MCWTKPLPSAWPFMSACDVLWERGATSGLRSRRGNEIFASPRPINKGFGQSPAIYGGCSLALAIGCALRVEKRITTPAGRHHQPC